MNATQINQLEHVADVVTVPVTTSMPYGLLQPSPCAGWTGRDVVNHMVGGADLFTGAAGEPVPFPDWSSMPDWLGTDPASANRDAANRAIAAFSAPGLLDGNVTMPWAEMPAAFALNMLVADHITHAWDLSRTTDLPLDIDEAAIEVALATCQASVSPEFRQAGFYGTEQTAPHDVTTLERLAAFTGRTL